MARYNEASCRLCRREGIKLYLKGDRCYSEKCGVSRKAYPPGMHGQKRQKVSEYGMQLREKQKARRVYGVLERQFGAVF
jgi:small subunit ribosomal protein S4